MFDGVSRASATITHNYPHLRESEGGYCSAAATASLVTDWDDAIVCGPELKIKRVEFYGLEPHADFYVMKMRAAEVNSTDNKADIPKDSGVFSEVYHRLSGTTKNSKDQAFDWSLPFAAGRMYSIWWSTYIDWTRINLRTSQYDDVSNRDDDGIIFRFDNMEQRELYTIKDNNAGNWANTKTAKKLDEEIGLDMNMTQSTCYNGESQHIFDTNTNITQHMWLCQSGKSKLYNDANATEADKYKLLLSSTRVDATMCLRSCPVEGFERDGKIRSFSGNTNEADVDGLEYTWPPITGTANLGNGMTVNYITGAPTQEGQNVYIHGNHTFLLQGV